MQIAGQVKLRVVFMQKNNENPVRKEVDTLLLRSFLPILLPTWHMT